MKKALASILFLALISIPCFAADWSPSVTITDDNGYFVTLAPKALVTITADTAMVDANGKYYRAIRPTTSVTVYYDGTPGTTYTEDADTIIPVHPDLRITVNTVCYVF